MMEINLLPWREQKREQQKKLFLIAITIAVSVAVLIVILVTYYASNLVSNQQARNTLLQKEITILDGQIKEIKLLKQIRVGLVSRMAIIQNLQSTRTLMVHLFDELIKIMPSGVYATKLERQSDIVTLWGYSESNTNVSFLMKNIEHNDWIHIPALTEVKKNEEKIQPANYEFKLSFVLKPQGWGQ